MTADIASLHADSVVPAQPSSDQGSTYNRLMQLLDRAQRAEQILSQAIRQADLATSWAQARSLLTLLIVREVEGPLRIGDFARVMGMEAQSATSMIDRLAALGLVERARGETDRRTIYLNLTEDGQVIAAACRDLVLHLLDQQIELRATVA